MKQFAAAALLGLVSWTGASAQVCVNKPLTVPLLAQSTIAVGTVTVSNDNNFFYVTFAVTGTWTIAQLDVAIGAALTDIPQTSSHSPSLSQFPYRQSFQSGVTTYTFKIPLGTTMEGSSVFIAAHAGVAAPCQGQKDAWGAGQLFAGSQACGKGGDDEDDDSHGEGGDGSVATLRFGADHHGGGGCGGEHGDDNRAIRPQGGHHGGGDPCGGHHGDGSRALSRDGGHEGGDGGDGGGCGSGSGCGATYFVYVANCINQE